MADLDFGKTRQDVMTVLEGDFVVRVIEATATKNSKGNPMIKAKLAIQAGPYTGRVIVNNFSITPDSVPAMQMFFSQMNILGLDGAYFDKLPNGDTGVNKIAVDLVGRVVQVKLGKREWQGVDRENVEGFSPAPTGMGGTPVAGQTVAQALPTAQPVTVNTAASTSKVVDGSASVDLPMNVGTPLTDPSNVPTSTTTEPPELPF